MLSPLSPYSNSMPMTGYGVGNPAMGGDPSMMVGSPYADPNLLMGAGAYPPSMGSSFGMPGQMRGAGSSDQAGLMQIVQALMEKMENMQSEMLAMFQAAAGPAGSPGGPPANTPAAS